MQYQADLRDIRFVLFDLLNLQQLLGAPPYEDLDRETVEQMLVEAEKFAREQLAPLNPIGDRVGCTFHDGQVTLPPGFREAYQAYCELGFLAAVAPPAEGGMGLPQAVSLALDELFVSANCAFSNYPSLSRACANMLRQWGTAAQQARYLPGLVSGRWQGTMCLTEAGAGSFVGACRCLARPRPDGQWTLTGQKVFITSANLDVVDNVVHFVLARTPDAPVGIKGISLFLVPHRLLDEAGEPAADNDVQIVGIEEKLGIHGSVTTTLSFGDEERCVGELVGTLHEGIRAMFQIMNEERVQVGLQGQAVGSAAYQGALQYARERVQGVPLSSKSRDPQDQVPILEHPDVRRMLLTMKVRVEGCRALLLKAGLHHDLARQTSDDAVRAYHEGWADLLTPVCKAYCSDLGFEVTVLAMQVFGGSGYVRETGVEQALRDSRIATIYEGTNGIQAQDLLFRKATLGRGRLMATLDQELQTFLGTVQGSAPLAAEAELLDEARQDAGRALAHLLELLGQGQVDVVGLHATAFLRLVGNLLLAWLLLQEAQVAAGLLDGLGLPADPAAREQRLRDDPAANHLAAKLPLARFAVRTLLPENAGIVRGILVGDRSALDVVL
ncbi:MAG: acyl-CoA dehydrogenase [Myxococcota bacterium]|jgi:alkylation response protein AidB-like acyl-CoA dehydrogenase|nr:acyl-CoA dehydrogenase [Myxococcota bacterium]